MRYHIQFPIDGFADIRKSLAEKYAYLLDITECDSKILPWSRANFLGLHTAVSESLVGTGLFVLRARFFITPPNFNLLPHIDGHASDRDSYYALNVPIICEDSNHWHRWFEYNGELNYETNNKYTFSLRAKYPQNLILKESLVLRTPTFVNIGVLHDIVNNTGNHRIILSIRFAGEGLADYVDRYIS